MASKQMFGKMLTMAKKAEKAGQTDWADPKKDYDMKDVTAICDGAKAPYSEQQPINVIRQKDGTPIHYKTALNNLFALLEGIGKYRKSHKELDKFDQYIVIVFGHSTHANADVGKLMKEYKVWTDIDLTSNIATNALTAFTPEVMKKTGNKKEVRYLESLTSTLAGEKPGQDLVKELFAPHGISPMYKAGVCMILSTDGSGVEHSHFDQEYSFAEIILGGKEVNKLDANMKKLTDFMRADPKKGSALTC